MNTNLKFARENFGYTTRSIAPLIRVGSSAISKYEVNRCALSPDLVEKFSQVLDCSFEFITGKSEVGIYAYYMDKKLVLSIEEYKDLEFKNLIEVVDYKRVISSNVEIKNLIPLVYGISKN